MIVKRWKANGMKPDDIGIIQDTDETFTRDFIIALQTCDIELFRPNQNCGYPKIFGSTLIFESLPACVWSDRRWFHPDVIIGECIETIGRPSVFDIILGIRMLAHFLGYKYVILLFFVGCILF